MPSANKDRIRVNLHVDREIYRLLKRMSYIMDKPVSRIFDDVFAPIVEEFKFDSFKECETDYYDRMFDFDSHKKDSPPPHHSYFREIFDTTNNPEINRILMKRSDKFLEIQKRVEEKKLPESVAKEIVDRTIAETDKEIEKIEEAIKEKEKLFSSRWKEAVDNEK